MSTPSDPRPEGHEPDFGQAPPPPQTPPPSPPPPPSAPQYAEQPGQQYGQQYGQQGGHQGAPQYAPHPGQQQGPKRLVRSSSDKMLSGVCGGLAAYSNLDPTLVRLLAVVAIVLTFPIGLIAYIVAAVVMPKA